MSGFVGFEMDTIDQTMVRQFLLGRASQADAARLEEKLLNDDEFLETLSAIEAELSDDYVRNRLSAEERSDFERHFLVTRSRQESVHFAEVLKNYVGLADRNAEVSEVDAEIPAEKIDDTSELRRPLKPEERRSWFTATPFRNRVLPYALAAAVVILLLSVAWMIFKRSRPEAGNLYAVNLIPSQRTRQEGDIQRISIPAGTGVVQFRLEAPSADYENFESLLLDGRGEIIWQIDKVKPTSSSGARILELNVPAELLKRDDYRLKIFGKSPAASDLLATYAIRIDS